MDYNKIIPQKPRFVMDKCGPFLDTQICIEVFVELFACTSKITFSFFFILLLPDMPLFS